MSQIVLTFDPACGVDKRTAAFWATALEAQAREFCAKYSIEPLPVNYYSPDVLLGLQDAALWQFVTDSFMVTVQTNINEPNALGFHDDVAGVIFARVLWQGDDTSITLSHEILEMLGDRTCDQYDPLGNGSKQAHEVCDRVEVDSYIEVGQIGTDIMSVRVSNYLYPSAFVPNSTGPWDRMGRLTTWDGQTPGGYMLVQAPDGSITDVYADTMEGAENAARKMKIKGSRVARRLELDP